MKRTIIKLGAGVALLLAVAVPLACASYGTIMATFNSAGGATVKSTTQVRTAPTANLTVDTIMSGAESGVGGAAVTTSIVGVDIAGNTWTVCSNAGAVTGNSAVPQVLEVGPSLTASGIGTGNTAICSAMVPDNYQVWVQGTSAVTTAVSATVYFNTSP